uniref:Uncharacterized protein n=1 Tax=viral metagenome TaxID=1070528 RepID=A0A6C0I320_9ZZZZ
MPAAAKQKLRYPEIQNQLYKQKTRQLSITRDRTGGFGLTSPPPRTIQVKLSSIATQGGLGSFCLKGNTIIQSNQSLTIPAGQILYLYNNNINQTPYSLTNYGTIIITHNTTPGGVASGIVALNSSYPFINTGTININGSFSSTLTGITNSGTINVQSNGSIIFSGNFTNTGVITNNGNGIYIGYQGNGTLTNAGTITNLKAGIINLGTAAVGINPPYNGTLINTGTITNNGTITRVPGLSTFTNNGTYHGLLPVPVS